MTTASDAISGPNHAVAKSNLKKEHKKSWEDVKKSTDWKNTSCDWWKKKQPIFMRSELRVPWKISQSSNLRTDTNSSPVNS
jgi:hypothetical protein